MDKSIKDALLLEKIGKFIRVPETLIRLGEVFRLNLTNIKGLDEKQAEILKQVLGVSKIGDLIGITISDENFLVLKALGIKPYQIASWLFIAKMVNEAKIDEFFGTEKISIIGLENAGKTALLNILQGNVNLEIIHNLNPTRGANRVILNKVESTYQIWDMAGQETYRLEYIQNAEKYFINLSIVVYVIDVQDTEKFEQSLNYFKEILNVLKILNENPEFLIILHKVDPDIKDNKDIKENIRVLKKQFKDILKSEKFTYEIITYSIYNWFGESKGLYKEVREYLLITPREERQSVGFLVELLEKILNVVVDLSANIEQRFLNIEGSINDLRNWLKYTESTSKKHPELKEKATKDKTELVKDVKSLLSGVREDLKNLLKIRTYD